MSMFFQLNEEQLRRILEQREQTRSSQAEDPNAPTAKYWFDAEEGVLVIDDPSLLMAVKESVGSVSEEDVDRVSFWNPPLGWRPMREHHHWVNENDETPTNQTPPDKS